MRLAEQEHAFWRAIRSRGGPPAFVEELFTASASQSAAERLAIYHRAYWQRQVTGLSDTFKKCAEVLGAGELERLLLAYIEASPSRAPCIEWSGSGFARFLEARPGVSPLVRDLSRLEWAALEALLAVDPAHVVKAPSTLGDQFVQSRVAFVPSLHVELVARSAWHVLQGDGLPQARDDRTPTHVAFWRPRFAVRHTLLAEDEGQAFELAREGATIGVICAAFSQLPPAEAVPRALSVLSSWFAREWVSSCEPRRLEP